jgi:hypothetical protein
METSRAGMSIFAVMTAVSVWAADDLPQRLSFDRYQPILNSTLFSLPAAQPSLTTHLYIKSAQRSCGITRFTLSDGREIVISPPPIDDNAIMYPTLPPKLPK